MIIIILHGRRCGSTFLCDCLGSHNKITNLGGIFLHNNLTMSNPNGYRKHSNKFTIAEFIEEILEGNLYKNNTKYTVISIPYDTFNEFNLLSILKTYDKSIILIHLLRNPINKVLSIGEEKITEKNIENFLYKLYEYIYQINYFSYITNIFSNSYQISYENLIGEKIKKDRKRKYYPSDKKAVKISDNYITLLSYPIKDFLCNILNIEKEDLYSYLQKQNSIKWFDRFTKKTYNILSNSLVLNNDISI